MATIPETFRRGIVQLRGPTALPWLERLPGELEACARRWSLALGEPYEVLSFNYVTRATLPDGTPVVLKVGMPDDKEFGMEAEALRFCEGRGMVRLLDADMGAEGAAMLLERIEPGVPLTAVEDDEAAISAAIACMRRFWRPAPPQHEFPTIERWGLGFERHRRHYGGSGAIPARLFERAERLYHELAASQVERVVLHGDFHQDNILSATREPWLAIDPKGVVGEPAYETGALLRNPNTVLVNVPDSHLKPLLARRVAQLADELGVERERVRGWGMAQAVLSSCWSLEGGQDDGWAQFTVRCAEALDAITV